jgi:hypothetical protein
LKHNKICQYQYFSPVVVLECYLSNVANGLVADVVAVVVAVVVS